ncbi:MAG: hypothetical protein HY646_07280 [Acidobacteria bacterium]|nr:hypothetical protein [Acidobacteriota bacterium]
MTPEQRLDRIEALIEKQNQGIQGLIVVGRTCLDSIQELREVQRKDHEEWSARMEELREAQAATDEKLNILIDTVDRIIRSKENGKQ